MTRYMFGMFCKTDEYGGGDNVFQRTNNVFRERIDQLKEKGLYNTIDILESENGACIIVDGKRWSI